MERKNYTVAVDLGSSSVVVAVGSKGAEGTLDVACVVSKPVEGVHAGKIENIELVSRAIREAVEEVQEQLGIRITEAYAGISGDFVRCARHTDHVFVYDPQNGVNRKDVDALFDRMRNVQAPDDETIMERVPQNTWSMTVRKCGTRWGRSARSSPRRSTSSSACARRSSGSKWRSSGWGSKCWESFGGAGLVRGGVAARREGGGRGGGRYRRGRDGRGGLLPQRGALHRLDPDGGASAINRDIRTMSVPEKHVESLKQKYGSAVAELASDEKLIRVNGRTAREAKDILLRNLATVIEARATDIAEFVLQEIRDSGYDGKLAYGIVLTGGSARLKDLDELFRRVTKMDVRVALPEAGISEESQARIADPAFSTAAGILLRGPNRAAAPSPSGRSRRRTRLLPPNRGARSLPYSRRSPRPGSGMCRPVRIRKRRRLPLRPNRLRRRRPPGSGSGRGSVRRPKRPGASATGARSSRRRSTRSTRVSRRPRTRRFRADPFVCIPVEIPAESPAASRQVPSEERGLGRAGFVNAAETRLPAGEKG